MRPYNMCQSIGLRGVPLSGREIHEKILRFDAQLYVSADKIG